MAKNKNKKTASKKTKFPKDVPTLQLKKESDIAMDFATKAYRKFDKLVKSVVLFGSTAKQTTVTGSDIDIIILLDDVSVNWDEELIAWYREELEKIIKANPYQQSLHINTVKLSTWWEDLMRGDPVVLNILRYGLPQIAPSLYSSLPALMPSTMKSRLTPYSFWAVTSLRVAPLRFHSPYSAITLISSVS